MVALDGSATIRPSRAPVATRWWRHWGVYRMPENRGRPGRRFLVAIVTAVLLAGVPTAALGAEPDPDATRTARMRAIVEKMQATDHVHPDGASHGHGGMAALSTDDLRFLGLRRGSGACFGMYEVADTTPGDTCTHGLDLPLAPSVAAAISEDCESGANITDCPAPAGWAGPTRIPCYTTGPFVEVLYIFWGATSALPTYKEHIRRSIASVDELFRVSAASVKSSVGTPGNRHVRWAMTSDCKLKVTAVRMGPGVEHSFQGVRQELASRGLLASTKKYLGYVDDGPCAGGVAERPSNSSPSTSNPNNKGGTLGIVIGQCFTDFHPYAGYGATIAAHELMHTIGAVQNDAPRTTMGHCWDDSPLAHQGADNLCYQDGLGTPTSKFYQRCTKTYPETFDCGKDDYFNPYPKTGTYLASHWNTAKNQFLATSDPATWDPIALPTVALAGNGSPVGGLKTFTATASPAAGFAVDRVEFLYGGELIDSDSTAPYTTAIDTFEIPNLTTIKVQARAIDVLGMAGPTTTASYTVANPQVHLDGPTVHLVASPKLNWSASALGAGGRTVAKVEFLVFDEVVASDTTKPYGAAINLAALTGLTEGLGYVEVAARVTDSAGVVRTTETRPMWIGTPSATLAPLHTYPVIGGTATSLQAAVTPALGVGIEKVEFLVNETLVGTDTTAPYAINWTPGATATKNLRVRITDKGGHVWNGQVEPFDVLSTTASVTITAPADGTLVDGPTLTVNGSATTPSPGTVDSLEVLIDGFAYETIPVPGGTVQVDLSGLAPGDHFVRVGATGDGGTWILGSTTRRFRIDGPDVTISGPAQGATVRQTVTVGASATDLAGTAVDNIDFYQGERWIGSDATAPYSIPWNTLEEPDGLARLTARASMSNGLVVVSSVRTVTKRNLTGWFTSPSPNATVSGPVLFKAGGRCDMDCRLENATFRVDGAAVKYDNAAPYTFTWDSTTVADGPHTYSITFSTSDARAVSTILFPFTVDNTP